MTAPTEHSRIRERHVGSSHCFHVRSSAAQTAFDEVLDNLEQRVTEGLKKECGVISLRETTLQDVLQQVIETRAYYGVSHGSSEILSAIVAFSRRICYYSNIIHLFLDDHPEYAAIAWSVMRLLLRAVPEQESNISILLTALCDVADALPKAELRLVLRPTLKLADTVGRLYAYILEFLSRALDWQEEGKVMHTDHSATTPSTFRYDDIIARTQHDTNIVESLVTTADHAEFMTVHGSLSRPRCLEDMNSKTHIPSGSLSGHVYPAIHISGHANIHLGDQYYHQHDISDRLSFLTSIVEHLRDDMARDRALTPTARMDSSERLTDNQCAQLLGHIPMQCLIDHKATLDTLTFLCNRQKMSSDSKRFPFWMSPKLREWNKSSKSSLVFVKGTFKERLILRKFCIDIIHQLSSSATAVLYVLFDRAQVYTLDEVFKSLIIQALGQDFSAKTGNTISCYKRKFFDAHIEEDFVNLLAEIIEHFQTIFIVVNAEVMRPEIALRCRVALRDLISRLENRNATTRVRILTTSQTPRHSFDRAVDKKVLKIGGVHAEHQHNRIDWSEGHPKRSGNDSDLFLRMKRGRKRICRR